MPLLKPGKSIPAAVSVVGQLLYLPSCNYASINLRLAALGLAVTSSAPLTCLISAWFLDATWRRDLLEMAAFFLSRRNLTLSRFINIPSPRSRSIFEYEEGTSYVKMLISFQSSSLSYKKKFLVWNWKKKFTAVFYHHRIRIVCVSLASFWLRIRFGKFRSKKRRWVFCLFVWIKDSLGLESVPASNNRNFVHIVLLRQQTLK